MLVLLVFVVASWCATPGAWELMFPKDEDCAASGMLSAAMMSPKCVDVGTGYSIQYYCEDESINKNVTMDIYKGEDCDGDPIYIEHVADVGKCFKETHALVDTYAKFQCLFDVNYSHMSFEIPIHVNQSDVGSSKNPIIATSFSRVGKCFPSPEYKFHTSLECDQKTKEGEAKFFATGACEIPFKTIKMKPEQIVNLGELTHKKMYVKYVGCQML